MYACQPPFTNSSDKRICNCYFLHGGREYGRDGTVSREMLYNSREVGRESPGQHYSSCPVYLELDQNAAHIQVDIPPVAFAFFWKKLHATTPRVMFIEAEAREGNCPLVVSSRSDLSLRSWVLPAHIGQSILLTGNNMILNYKWFIFILYPI